ncbi:hypothetical protein ACFPMF_22775 [Larkinella bovis]|uniref:Universal stress protein n=1 Tax=Larkinella bovis TaxID=683041 RepID=A0ABW0IFC1_9BACT
MQALHPASTIHFLFITDETGMGAAFALLKSSLVAHPANHVSLVYHSPAEPPVFQRELAILSRHFPTQFIPYYETGQPTELTFVPQETLEAILNTNTREELRILIYGTDEFMTSVREQLLFLNVEKKAIKLHFLR